MHGPQPSLVLRDARALMSDLSAFIDAAVPDGSRRAHERHWRWWTELCEAIGEDPRRASFDAWRQVLDARRPDGRFYSAKRPGQVLSAVRVETEGDVIPAPDLPEHCAEWKALVGAYGRMAGDQGCPCDEDEVCTCGVVPATREHVDAILSVPYTSMRYRGGGFVHVRRPGNEAAMLVALDTGLNAYTLSRVDPTRIELLDDGSVRIEGRLIRCDHRPRERGVPWPCGACAVRSALKNVPDGVPVFGSADSLTTLFAMRRAEWHRTLYATLRANGTFASELLLRNDLTPRQVAGVRLGLATSCWQNPEGAWLLGRAWFAIAFAAGYRMCGDLASLNRSAVQYAPDGSFVSVTLAVTKSDQTASTTVVRPFVFGAEGDPAWAAECFTTYLTVRDALVGQHPDEPLWMSAPPRGARGQRISTMKDPVKQANRMLAELTRLLDLPHLTTYSARKGYVEEAFEARWAPTRTQAGMRHVYVDTTLRHYRARRPKEAVSRLAQSREQQLSSRREVMT